MKKFLVFLVLVVGGAMWVKSKLSGEPRPRTTYERAPIEPGMMPGSPRPARTAPLRVTSNSSPKCRSRAQ